MCPKQLYTSQAHKDLVKKALLRLIDRVDNIVVINIELEMGEIEANISIGSFIGSKFDVSQTSRKRFEPDVLAVQQVGLDTEEGYGGKKEEIKKVEVWVIEAETGTRNLLRDTYRKTAYKLLKLKDEDRREKLHLILAIYDDVKVPDKIAPFDEIWKFQR